MLPRKTREFSERLNPAPAVQLKTDAKKNASLTKVQWAPVCYLQLEKAELAANYDTAFYLVFIRAGDNCTSFCTRLLLEFKKENANQTIQQKKRMKRVKNKVVNLGGVHTQASEIYECYLKHF